MILENTKKQFNIIEENQPVNSYREDTIIFASKEENNIELIAEKKQIIIEPEEKVINLILEKKAICIEVGTANEGASLGNAIQIQGLPVDTASPKEGELFYFDGAKWTAKDGREESCLNFNTIINGGYF